MLLSTNGLGRLPFKEEMLSSILTRSTIHCILMGLFMTPEEIVEKVKFYRERVSFHTQKLLEVRESCQFHKGINYNSYHGNRENEQYVERHFNSNTGNYDPQDDSYWCVVTCKVCGERFTVYSR